MLCGTLYYKGKVFKSLHMKISNLINLVIIIVILSCELLDIK